MARTYLQLVNDVLANLRESPVSTLAAAPPYPSLIAAYVNKAKEKVEDAWAWRALTTACNITTTVGQAAYVLDNTAPPSQNTYSSGTLVPNRYITDRAFLIRDSEGVANVIATLTGSVVLRLTEWAYEDLIWNIRAVVVLVNQPPYGFAYSPVGGTPTLLLARPANAAYNVEARFCNPQIPLAVDADIMLCPYQPVVSFATALAMQERGEELGTNADLYMDFYRDELTRAINNDVENVVMQFKNS